MSSCCTCCPTLWHVGVLSPDLEPLHSAGILVMCMASASLHLSAMPPLLLKVRQTLRPVRSEVLRTLPCGRQQSQESPHGTLLGAKGDQVGVGCVGCLCLPMSDMMLLRLCQDYCSVKACCSHACWPHIHDSRSRLVVCMRCFLV